MNKKHKTINKKHLRILLPFSVILLLTISIFLLKFSVKNKQILQNRAEEKKTGIFSESAIELRRNIEEYIKNPDDKSFQNVISKEQEIKTSLIKILTTSPDGPKNFLREVETNYPKKFIDNLPDKLKKKGLYINYVQDLKGKTSATVTDNFETGESRTYYKIGDYNLYFAGKQPENLTFNQTATVGEGITIENELIIDNRKKDQLTLGTPEKIKTTGDFKIGVILFKLPDEPNEEIRNNPDKPFKPSDVEDTFFSKDKAESVYKYFDEVSYGKMKISGELLTKNWITLKNQSSRDLDRYGSCTNEKWSQAATEDESLQNVDLASFDKIIYIFPTTNTCTSNRNGRDVMWGGIARLDSREIWINGYNDLGTFSHELGHSLGLAHTRMRYCKEKTNNYESCSSMEYLESEADGFDRMSGNRGIEKSSGNLYIGHFNAYYKQKLGWLPDTNIIDDKSQNLDKLWLTPLEIKADDESWPPQILKILIPPHENRPLYTPPDFYELEYRRPIKFDEKTPLAEFKSMIKGGVTIRRVNGFLYFIGIIDLINPNPIIPGRFFDAFLLDNVPFYDADNKISITQLEHQDYGAEIKVEYNAPPPLQPSITPQDINLTIKIDNRRNFTYPYDVRIGLIWCTPKQSLCLKDKSPLSFVYVPKYSNLDQPYSVISASPPASPLLMLFPFIGEDKDDGWFVTGEGKINPQNGDTLTKVIP